MRSATRSSSCTGGERDAKASGRTAGTRETKTPTAKGRHGGAGRLKGDDRIAGGRRPTHLQIEDRPLGRSGPRRRSRERQNRLPRACAAPAPRPASAIAPAREPAERDGDEPRRFAGLVCSDTPTHSRRSPQSPRPPEVELARPPSAGTPRKPSTTLIDSRTRHAPRHSRSCGAPPPSPSKPPNRAGRGAG